MSTETTTMTDTDDVPCNRCHHIHQPDDVTLDTLARAARWIDIGWCTGALARDAAGATCDPRSPDAVAWCAAGAITAALGHGDNADTGCCEAMEALEVHIGDDVSAWNDAPNQTGWHVAAALRAAAERE